MERIIVDLFAGPGGWDEGLTLTNNDLPVIGIEWDEAACRTALAAGHLRVQADVAAYPTKPFAGRTVGLIASPPCQAFSLAGKQAGTKAVDQLLAHVWECRDGWVQPDAELCDEDVRADLTLQPLRWVDELRPEWVAFEQVPPVRPLWDAIGHVFALWGYEVTTAVLNAADYGVPQTRKRAILVASRTQRVSMPEPTHFDPRKGASLFGQPWVSMADALGWVDGEVGFPRVDDLGTSPDGYRERDWRDVTRPSFTVTEKARSWVVRTGNNSMKHSRNVDEIAPYERPVTEPAPTVDCKAGSAWGLHRGRKEVRRLAVEEVGVLQTFPVDYPWRGSSKSKKHEQIGNAVPPLLGAVILCQFVGGRATEVAA